QAIVRAMSPFFNEVAGALALGGALIYAGGLVARGAIEARVLISFLTALLLLYRPIKGIGNAISQIAAGRASVDRLGELLVLAPEETGEPLETSRGSQPRPPSVLMRRLALSGVGFCHGETWVFRGIDLSIRPGEIVAIRGVSGAGKSTLCDILAGLEGPTEGNIHWDDEIFGPKETIPLRGRVALVPQQPLLWPGSVADNLRDAAPEADEADLWAALDAAGLADRVRALSLALDSPIGPGSGAGLSVGEVQRLALARALLRDRSVIVLDEPSSALDDDHETRLLRTLEGLRPGRVIVLVSHRPTLLAGADRLFELCDGELGEVTGPLS
ncbi:MAG: ABC transporter ATP-binding protein, partial [Deltaproteobacteria bacterium]|nr:ABC transporter ATP-binding protein [Deltaproteobacteria bacterium]